MNFKNVIPFAALLVCSLGNPAQVEARTPQQVTGNCILTVEDRMDFRCTVTPDGGGGYIVDAHGAVHENFYVNRQARELYYGAHSCSEVSIRQSENFTSAMCVSSESLWDINFPTR
ncbi:hypothetical protein SCREM2_gp99 [Synechococcus phage S-CREM2]|nr:hypothetical protein SCREM2_gp99 [Synechococcus phage S-CREM2]